MHGSRIRESSFPGAQAIVGERCRRRKFRSASRNRAAAREAAIADLSDPLKFSEIPLDTKPKTCDGWIEGETTRNTAFAENGTSGRARGRQRHCPRRPGAWEDQPFML